MLKNISNWLGGISEEGEEQSVGDVGRYGEDRLREISLEYQESTLEAATQNWAPARKLGAGNYGAVFRGTLPDGHDVAIKVIDINEDDDGAHGFADEVRVLSKFRHPNLVTLMGWAMSGVKHGKSKRYLVYECLTGGDVNQRLLASRNDGGRPFYWQERLWVALDAACGLAHMHNSHPKAFHRDIKSPNILLDRSGTAKMADFGLSGIAKNKEKLNMTCEQIAGTPGYACPHYIKTGRVTEQTEVYAFGMVMLELLLNSMPACLGQGGNIVYPIFQVVQPTTPGALDRALAAVDAKANWPPQLARELAEFALKCSDMRMENRPVFTDVGRRLRMMCDQFCQGERGMPSTDPKLSAIQAATLAGPPTQAQPSSGGFPGSGGMAPGGMAPTRPQMPGGGPGGGMAAATRPQMGAPPGGAPGGAAPTRPQVAFGGPGFGGGGPGGVPDTRPQMGLPGPGLGPPTQPQMGGGGFGGGCGAPTRPQLGGGGGGYGGGGYDGGSGAPTRPQLGGGGGGFGGGGGYDGGGGGAPTRPQLGGGGYDAGGGGGGFDGGAPTRPQLGGGGGGGAPTRPQLGGSPYDGGCGATGAPTRPQLGGGGGGYGAPTRPQLGGGGYPGAAPAAAASGAGFDGLVRQLWQTGWEMATEGQPAMTLGESGRSPAELADVVLECTEASGVNLSGMQMKEKCLALRSGESPWTVGRQHQSNMFARLVPDEKVRGCISRSHLVFTWQKLALRMKKTSPNVVLLNGTPVPPHQEMAVPNGAQIGLCGQDNLTTFLTFTVVIRDASAPAPKPQPPPAPPAEAQVPATGASMSGSPAAKWWCAGPPTPYRLICGMAFGRDVRHLALEARAISLPPGRSLMVGRMHQLGFFEGVLGDEPGARYLCCVSRSHLEISDSDGSGCFELTNHSANPVVLAGRRKLGKNDSGIVRPGDCVEFIGNSADGSGAPVTYLRFDLERTAPASQHGAGGYDPYPEVPPTQPVHDTAQGRPAGWDGGRAAAPSSTSSSMPSLLPAIGGAPERQAQEPQGGAPFWLLLGGSAVRPSFPQEERRLEGRADGLTVGRAHQQALHANAFDPALRQYLSRDHFRIECGRDGCRLVPLSSNPIWLRSGDTQRPREAVVGEPAMRIQHGDEVLLFTGADDCTHDGPGNLGVLRWSFQERRTR